LKVKHSILSSNEFDTSRLVMINITLYKMSFIQHIFLAIFVLHASVCIFTINEGALKVTLNFASVV